MPTVIKSVFIERVEASRIALFYACVDVLSVGIAIDHLTGSTVRLGAQLIYLTHDR